MVGPTIVSRLRSVAWLLILLAPVAELTPVDGWMGDLVNGGDGKEGFDHPPASQNDVQIITWKNHGHWRSVTTLSQVNKQEKLLQIPKTKSGIRESCWISGT